jgi:hypothetical protein
MPLNITNIASVVGTTSAVNNISTTGTVVLGPVVTNHCYKINSVIAANKTNTTASVTLTLNRGSIWTTLAYQMQVPSNAAIILVGKDAPFYMMDSTADILSAAAGSLTAIDIIASYEDMS